MDKIGRDLKIEVLARLGPGRDALRCTRVCKTWDAYLRTEWAYLRMIQCRGLPRNKDIFGAGEGVDPNRWSGYQKDLANSWGWETKALRASIVRCRTATELVRVMYGKGRSSRAVLLAAIDHYQRFDHAPLWILAG